MTESVRERGSLRVGTSGFAYPAWSPVFYPPRTRSSELLHEYATRLPAVELNNTFYQQPKPDKIAAWLAATPADFRFVVKAQRGASMRAFGADAAQSLEWLTTPYRLFGNRLGAVLFRIPAPVKRDDVRLAAMLAAWPSDMPLVMEFQDPSWHVDEVFDLLAAHGSALCATDLDDGDEPDLRLTGQFVYLRLRRTTYTHDDVRRWTDRLKPFLESGVDCYVFFRHDETGESALRAVALRELGDIARSIP